MIRTPLIYSDEFWQEQEMTDTVNDTKPEPKVAAFELQANMFIQNATSMYVNGLRSSIPQAPLANLMVKACSALGVAIGQVFSIGQLADIFQLRQACIEAFSKGVKSVKVEGPPMAEKLKFDA